METTTDKVKRNRSGKFSRREVIDALKANKGGVYATANALGCHYSTIYNYANRYHEIKAILDDARHVILDKAELKIDSLMDSDNEAIALKACIFYLETIGKERGYTRQRDTTVNNNLIVDIDKMKDAIAKRVALAGGDMALDDATLAGGA